MPDSPDPRFRELRAEVLSTVPDHSLAAAVYTHALHHCLPSLDQEMAIISALPLPVRAVYATVLLDNEVLNGGFSQFFWNSTGQFARMAVEGLDYFGAQEHARVTRAAVAVYESGRAGLTRFREEGSDEAFRSFSKASKLQPFDEQYYALGGDSLSDILSQFIRHHLQDFNSGAPAA